MEGVFEAEIEQKRDWASGRDPIERERERESLSKRAVCNSQQLCFNFFPVLYRGGQKGTKFCCQLPLEKGQSYTETRIVKSQGERKREREMNSISRSFLGEGGQ